MYSVKYGAVELACHSSVPIDACPVAVADGAANTRTTRGRNPHVTTYAPVSDTANCLVWTTADSET